MPFTLTFRENMTNLGVIVILRLALIHTSFMFIQVLNEIWKAN